MASDLETLNRTDVNLLVYDNAVIKKFEYFTSWMKQSIVVKTGVLQSQEFCWLNFLELEQLQKHPAFVA